MSVCVLRYTHTHSAKLTSYSYLIGLRRFLVLNPLNRLAKHLRVNTNSNKCLSDETETMHSNSRGVLRLTVFGCNRESKLHRCTVFQRYPGAAGDTRAATSGRRRWLFERRACAAVAMALDRAHAPGHLKGRGCRSAF